MAIIIAVVLGLLALAFVLQPLYKSTPNPKDASPSVVRRGVSEPRPGDDKGKPPPFLSDPPPSYQFFAFRVRLYNHRIGPIGADRARAGGAGRVARG